MSAGKIDCHQHPGDVGVIQRTFSIADMLGFEKVCLVCTGERDDLTSNPLGFLTKAKAPERTYLFAGLEHSSVFAGAPDPDALPLQLERLLAVGADGVKLLEGKPTTRRVVGIALDDDYFGPFFQAAEEKRVPLLWHVADPEEFWDPAKTPSWAAERGWGYGPEDVPKETLYREAENVLERHPGLRVILAHFYFLSADIARADRFLEEHPHCGFDLAPGVEMLYNLSRDPDRTREFFLRHRDRIFFGTDMSPHMSDEEARSRSGIVTRFLETEDEFRVPPEADFLLGKPEDGTIRGIALPGDVLEDIYSGNFRRLAGDAPGPFRPDLAAEECGRIASLATAPSRALAAAEALKDMA